MNILKSVHETVISQITDGETSDMEFFRGKLSRVVRMTKLSHVIMPNFLVFRRRDIQKARCP